MRRLLFVPLLTWTLAAAQAQVPPTPTELAQYRGLFAATAIGVSRR